MLERGTDTFDVDHLAIDATCITTAAERLRRISRPKGKTRDPSVDALVDQLLAAAAELEQQVSEQQARIRYLESLSMTDELTGLLNRRGFRCELDHALARARRRQETGLLVLFDLDLFKAINDSYGHMAGDAVLCAVAEVLRQRTRKSDYLARLGGDEFAVLMTDTAPQRGETLASKLDRLINGLIVKWRHWEIPVSASFGVEVYGQRSRPDGLLSRADRALYRRKRQCQPVELGA